MVTETSDKVISRAARTSGSPFAAPVGKPWTEERIWAEASKKHASFAIMMGEQLWKVAKRRNKTALSSGKHYEDPYKL